MKVVLYQPDIPQNTGNIGRTCVALGASLVLIRPLGFSLSDKFIKRSGMDYWEHLDLTIEDSLENVLSVTQEENLYFLSTKGTQYYAEGELNSEGVYIFGSESRGLPSDVFERYPQRIYTIPMLEEARSLNLATSVGIVLYEVVRQNYAVSSMFRNH